MFALNCSRRIIRSKLTKGSNITIYPNVLRVQNMLFSNAITDELGDPMKPRDIVKHLDQHIVGQSDAKKAVAVALRNRWRRQRLPDDLKNEVIPKNILMIGPTGCGKTEIARRMAKFADAPFIKVEATKFTEVGFHGRDVEQIIRDLVEVSITLTKKKKKREMKEKAKDIVNDRLLVALTGEHSTKETKESFRDLLEKGELEEREISIDIPTPTPDKGISIDPSNQISIHEIMGKMQKAMTNKKSQRKILKIKEARDIILDIEAEKLVEGLDIENEAGKHVEDGGIVFIDEIDKICSHRDNRSGADASDEGVQRDLLPLLEGTTISTKYGNINTDHILFVASGAFHQCQPSDLLAELQGRLPIRVELNGLTTDDLYRILTQPIANLIRQQTELLKTEDVSLIFEDDAIKEIAEIAAEANKNVENIGARRLHTVLEKIMEDISFEAPDYDDGKEIIITKELVKERVEGFLKSSDMSKFIL